MTTESRDALWKQKVQEDLINRRGKNIIYSPYLGYFQHWMDEKKLPESFFPYFLIGSPEVNEPQNLMSIINEIVQIVQTVKSDFQRNCIKFKSFGDEFQDDVICFKNNVIYFSNKLGNINYDRLKNFGC